MSDDKISNISELPLNQYLDEDLKIESSNGNIITADMIIPCYGSSVNAEAYSKPLSKTNFCEYFFNFILFTESQIDF